MLKSTGSELVASMHSSEVSVRGTASSAEGPGVEVKVSLFTEKRQ